jgi:hypothetical protein
MKLLIIIIIFLIIGGLIIVIGYNINLGQKQGKKAFLITYSKWLLEIGTNVKNLIGFAIKQDWLPQINRSNISINITEDYIIENT